MNLSLPVYSPYPFPSLVTIIRFLHPGLHFSFVNTFICRYHFLKFHLIKEISDDTCLSLSDLLHSAWQSVGPSMSPQMALFHSFFWLRDNPLYHFFSIHSSSMDSPAPIRKHRHLSITPLSLHAYFLPGKDTSKCCGPQVHWGGVRNQKRGKS